MKKQKSYSEQVAESIIEHIKNGTAPWQRPWKTGEATATAPMNPLTGKQYQGGNSIHLRNAGFDDPRWLTYKQAQEMGGQVLKGEKGVTIRYVKKGQMQDVLDKNGNPQLDENGEAQRRFVQFDKPKVFSARVFNGEQIDGLPPLPPLDERIKSIDWDIDQRAEDILTNSDAEIHYKNSEKAFYLPARDYIQLPERSQFEDEQGFYATAFHELGHWTGHENRLDRDLSNPFGTEGYAREELRAEISAFMNAQKYGIQHSPGQHAAYVESWMRVLDENPQEVINASKDAQSIVNYIAKFDPQQQTHKMSQKQSIEERIYLTVPYKEKDQAKALGAKWDGKEKSWYAPADTNLEPLQKWVISDNQQAEVTQQTTYMPEPTSDEKTYLAVPFSEKDDAKVLGAKWDKEAKSWYAPEGTDIKTMQKWLPENQTQTAPSLDSDPIREFSHALQAAGLDVKNIQADGELHRVPIQGKPNGKDGAYKLHLDDRPAGYIQNFVTGHKENWVGGKQELTQEQLAVQQAKLAAQRAEREQKRERSQKENAKKATDEFQQLPKATPDHPYLAKKGLSKDIIDKMDLRIDKEGKLVVPVKNNDDEIQTLQRIGGNGFKQFESGCKAQGGFNIIGENVLKAQDKNEPVIISTGVATAASIHMATGEPVVVAFQDSNLKAVAEEFKAMYPYRSVFVAGDNDQHNVSNGLKNSGLVSAKAAAKAVGGRYGVPKFAVNQQGKQFSDFSDLHRVAGLAAVKRQIRTGLSIARANVNEDKQREQAINGSKERAEKQKEVKQQKQEEKRRKGRTKKR